MTQQERFLLACALMRKLWQKYDSGGHSMGRSLRSGLLESVLWLAPQDLPNVDPSFDFHESLKRLRLPEISRSPPLPQNLSQLSLELFAGVAMYQLLDMHTDDSSLFERNIVESIVLLLGEKDPKAFLQLRGPINPKQVIEEGRKRLDSLGDL